MLKVILTKGLPASGKSTWAKQFIHTHPNYKRVCRDDLRLMLDAVQFNEKKEKFITQVEHALILQALKAGFSVVVDATHLNSKNENSVRKLVSGLAEVEVKSFLGVSVERCIANDACRSDGVGEKVIRDMYKKYVSPHRDTSNEISPIDSAARSPSFIEHDPNLPDAIICDIDGTLALHPQRSHYDYAKVSTDVPNGPIVSLVQKLLVPTKAALLVVSGREDFCQVDTFDWLTAQKIPFSKLFMRKTKDNRADNIIKREIYEEHIKSKYNVLWVIDDRDRVVREWRSLGLTCLQIAEGNF